MDTDTETDTDRDRDTDRDGTLFFLSTVSLISAGVLFYSSSYLPFSRWAGTQRGTRIWTYRKLHKQGHGQRHGQGHGQGQGTGKWTRTGTGKWTGTTIPDEATLSIDVEKMETMKQLFAIKIGNRSDEATLSLLNV